MTKTYQEAKGAQPTAGEKSIPNSRGESKEQEEQCQLQAETYEKNNVSKTEVTPMTRSKDTESHRRMEAEQEVKVAEKAREHQVEIEEEIVVEELKDAELKEGVTQKQQKVQQTVQQFQIAEAVRAIAANESEEQKHEMKVETEKVVKAQKEAQFTAEENKLYTTSKAGQRPAGVTREGIHRESGS